MLINFIKIFCIIYLLIYQSTSFSKTTNKEEFNHRYLSNYFSALVSYDNEENDRALKYFNSSKFLLSKHDNYLKDYLYLLVENGKFSNAIKQAKNSIRSQNANFFEANLLLYIDSVKNKNFLQASKHLSDLRLFLENNTYEYVIYETLKSYNNLFLNGEITDPKENFGKLSLITRAFQNCYLNSNNTEDYFLKLINKTDGDYSRYLFFYLSYIISNKDYGTANIISKNINSLSSTLLVSQAKSWIEDSNFNIFKDHFSCKTETDILAEFFFLLSNLYSAEEEYKKSIFYLNLSYYLNSKFYFNLSLLTENYFDNANYELTRKFLKRFNKKHDVYQWYKIKKIGKIIANQKNDKQSLEYIENKFNQIKKPSTRVLFDLANIYKSFEKYKESIKYYSIVLSKLDKESKGYAETLYRRGSSYERIKDFDNSDKDLLRSLDINPEDPYVMNYLGYSWLERKYNIDEAINMLNRAYQLTENDPYIIDSVGWGYYLIGDYLNAEKFIKRSVIIMPNDPIVNDHYGDILWKLDRKIQAKYFWENVLNLESTDEEMKKKIYKKLIFGLEKT